MNFPKKNWLGNPKGWEDLGDIENHCTKEYKVLVMKHVFCNTRVRIGREDGELFYFCPRCMVKTNYKKEK